MTALAWPAFCDDAGHFALDDLSAFRRWVKKAHTGRELVVIVKRKSARQGTQSMRYYRGVVVPDVARACGYTDPDEWKSVHNGLAWKFLRLPDGPFGEPRRKSTRKDEMPQDEMTAYIDQVITYAETSIPGCRVRRPEEVDLETVWEQDYDEDES